MLTDEDIKKIIEPNREVFPTKEDFENFKQELRESFSDLQTSVDTYVKTTTRPPHPPNLCLGP